MVAAFQHVVRQLLGAVGQAHVLLNPVVRHGHLAAGQGGGPAVHAQLLHEQHLLALVRRADGGRESRAAGSHHHDVVGCGDAVGRLRQCLVALLPLRRFLAGLVERFGHGVEVRHARERGAGDYVDVERLMVDDELAQLVHAHVAESHGLARFQHVDALDDAVLRHHFNLDGSVLAHSGAHGCRACVFGNRARRLARRRAAAQRQRAARGGERRSGEKLPARKSCHDVILLRYAPPPLVFVRGGKTLPPDVLAIRLAGGSMCKPARV